MWAASVTGLRSLDASGCSITDGKNIEIGTRMPRTSTLTSLSLARCRISDGFFALLLGSPSLVTLDLRWAKTGGDMSPFVIGLSALTELRHLDISGWDSIQKIVPVIFNSSGLTELHMRHCSASITSVALGSWRRIPDIKLITVAGSKIGSLTTVLLPLLSRFFRPGISCVLSEDQITSCPWSFSPVPYHRRMVDVTQLIMVTPGRYSDPVFCFPNSNKGITGVLYSEQKTGAASDMMHEDFIKMQSPWTA